MSEPKDPERRDAADGEDAVTKTVDDSDVVEVSREEFDDLDDLGDLDEEGFDEAVAAARAAASDDPDPSSGDRLYTKEEVGLARKVGWGRSPIISAAVVVVGVFLLIATWSDFRYFLRATQSEPRDLGRADQIYKDGEFTENFANEWVVLEGDPDVQHAARMPSREGWIGFLRLIEAEGSLFVAVPRATEKATNEFPGRFQGRMVDLDDTPQWEKLRVFFQAEELIDIVDLEPASAFAAFQSGLPAEVETADGKTTSLAAKEELRVIVRQSVGMAQLGRDTWKTKADAERYVEGLGLPYTFVEKRSTVWVFAVHVGTEADVEVFQRLTRALNGGEDLVSPDPKQGGIVLPRRATYLVEAGDVQVEGERVSFTYGDNTAETGWTLEGEELVPVELAKGRLSVAKAAVEEIRVERSLDINPDGYLVMVGQEPMDVWPSAVMFIAVFGVVLLNLWALLGALRRRRAAAAS